MMIKPILCYGGEIWSWGLGVDIENVHDNFCKKVLKLPPCTFNVFARGECRRFLDIYRLFLQVYQILGETYAEWIQTDFHYKCYKILRNLDENGRIAWASKVREMLFRYGFGYVWHMEIVGDINSFMKTFKQRLIDCSRQDWWSKVAESGKAGHYKFIAPAIQVVNYMNYNLTIKLRISLSKLKCYVHRFNVEIW